MKTVTIDTNLLVRYYNQEQPWEEVVSLLSDPNKKIFISEHVIVELVYTLSSYSKQPRDKIAKFINGLLSLTNVISSPLILKTLEIYISKPKLSFVDIFIYLDAIQNERLPVYTLDLALQKLDSKNIVAP